jgi:hypothetical protein
LSAHRVSVFLLAQRPPLVEGIYPAGNRRSAEQSIVISVAVVLPYAEAT